MKKFYAISFSLFLTLASFCQTVTTVLTPVMGNGQDAYLSSIDPNGNYGAHPEFAATAWSCSGSLCIGRCLVEFDLSGIPAGAVIISASLDLYANPNPGNQNGVAMVGPGNDCYLQRVTSPWQELGVTWNNQPSVTSSNQYILPASSTNFQNYTGLNVTSLVTDMINNPSSSYGFEISLANESYYRGMIFCSSDYPDTTLYPHLTINYTVGSNITCTDLSIDNNGHDAYLSSIDPNGNYGAHPEFAATAWSCGGSPCLGRCVMNFDMSTIPSNATVLSASLDLYANPSPGNQNGIAMVGPGNDSYLQRVTSPWVENAVTWNTQPNTTVQNEVTLNASTTNFQNYLGINVQGLVADMVANSSNSYGFMIREINENYYRGMIFASRDYPNTALHSILHVCYSVATGVTINPVPFQFNVYPNPSKGVFELKGSNIMGSNVNIRDILGQVIYSDKIDENNFKIDLKNTEKGVYTIEVYNQNQRKVIPVVIIN